MGTTIRKGAKSFLVVTISYYHLECSKCGRLSPEGLSPEETLEIATDNGWLETHDGRMICPDCIE